MHEALQYLANKQNPSKLKVQYKGEKRTLFRSEEEGVFGIVSKGKRSRGCQFTDWDNITKIYYPKEVNHEEHERKLVQKYKREAAKANFTNPFIRYCLNSDLNKSLYQNQITVGCSIDGKIISTKRLLKEIGQYELDLMFKAITDKAKYNHYFTMDGYECRIDIRVALESDGYQTVGDVFISLTLEKNCKEYSYLLINNENFIGYDVD